MSRTGVTAVGGVVGGEKRGCKSVRGRPTLSLVGKSSLSPSGEVGCGGGGISRHEGGRKRRRPVARRPCLGE